MKSLDPVLVLQKLKRDYYDKIGIVDKVCRKRVFVEARYAFFVVAASRFSLSDIGRAFNMTHSMVIHARKSHQTNARFSKEYPLFYAAALDIMKDYEVHEDEQIEQLKTLATELLAKEIVRLRKKIRMYEQYYRNEFDLLALQKDNDQGEERQEVLFHDLSEPQQQLEDALADGAIC